MTFARISAHRTQRQSGGSTRRQRELNPLILESCMYPDALVRLTEDVLDRSAARASLIPSAAPAGVGPSKLKGVSAGLVARTANLRILGKSPLGIYLRTAEGVWDALPASLKGLPPAIAYGRLMHALVRSSGQRQQYFGTFFVRNRPQLQLICRLAGEHPRGAPLRVAVLGCSIGAEAYSLAWAIRSAAPDLSLRIDGVDISPEVLEVAREGLYPLGVAELANEPLCERLTREEIDHIFETEPRGLRVRPWIRAGIRWQVGDLRDPAIGDVFGRYDVVVANDFLCHMDPAEAGACLRNIARLVAEGGHLVVSGVDLDMRTDVAADLGWKPVTDLIEEIHEGDRSLRRSWPWRYWGLEPLDSGRRDWNLRYASVFQLGGAS